MTVEYTEGKNSLLLALLAIVVLLIVALFIIYALYLTGTGAPQVVMEEDPDDPDDPDDPVDPVFSGIAEQKPPVEKGLYENNLKNGVEKGIITLNRVGTMVTISWTGVLLENTKTLYANIDEEFAPADAFFYQSMTALQAKNDAFATLPLPIVVFVSDTILTIFQPSETVDNSIVGATNLVLSGSITYPAAPAV